MNLKKMKKDTSGLATILIVVIVVVIVVVAAGAAAFVLTSNNNNNESKDAPAVQDQIAPGTFMEFDMFVDNEKLGTFSIEYLGQNATEYFTKVVMSMNLGLLGTYEIETYSLDDKATATPGAPTDADLKKVGTINNFDTFAGKKKVDKWEYTEKIGSTNYKGYLYIDSSTDIIYKIEMPMDMGGGVVKTLVMDVKAFTLLTQKPSDYTPSANMGKTTRFALSTNPSKLVELKVVADCKNNKYGVAFDFSNVISGETVNVYLCDSTDGMITGATKVSGDMWKYSEEVMGITYLEINIYKNTAGVYKIVYKDMVNTYTFNLVAA